MPAPVIKQDIRRQGPRFSLPNVDLLTKGQSLLISTSLIIYCYTSRSRIFYSWRRHHCRWRATKFRPMLVAEGLWAGRDLYRATPTVTRDLGFFGLIRTTAPFSRLFGHARGCWGLHLTWISWIPIQSPLTTRKGMLGTYSDSDLHGSQFSCLLRHARGYWGPIPARILPCFGGLTHPEFELATFCL
jgi:hypothetical protein